MSSFFLHARWVVGTAMVCAGTVAASWGAFDVAQMRECGTEMTASCSLDVFAPILALGGGLTLATLGAVFARSGRLFLSLFGFILAGGGMAAYLSLNGPNADPTVDAGALGVAVPLLGIAIGLVLFAVATKKNPPVVRSRGGGSAWGGGSWDSSWDGGGDGSSDSGCSSGCGGGCGGGGD